MLSLDLSAATAIASGARANTLSGVEGGVSNNGSGSIRSGGAPSYLGTSNSGRHRAGGGGRFRRGGSIFKGRAAETLRPDLRDETSFPGRSGASSGRSVSQNETQNQSQNQIQSRSNDLPPFENEGCGSARIVERLAHAKPLVAKRLLSSAGAGSNSPSRSKNLQLLKNPLAPSSAPTPASSVATAIVTSAHQAPTAAAGTDVSLSGSRRHGASIKTKTSNSGSTSRSVSELECTSESGSGSRPRSRPKSRPKSRPNSDSVPEAGIGPSRPAMQKVVSEPGKGGAAKAATVCAQGLIYTSKNYIPLHLDTIIGVQLSEQDSDFVLRSNSHLLWPAPGSRERLRPDREQRGGEDKERGKIAGVSAGQKEGFEKKTEGEIAREWASNVALGRSTVQALQEGFRDAIRLILANDVRPLHQALSASVAMRYVD